MLRKIWFIAILFISITGCGSYGVSSIPSTLTPDAHLDPTPVLASPVQQLLQPTPSFIPHVVVPPKYNNQVPIPTTLDPTQVPYASQLTQVMTLSLPQDMYPFIHINAWSPDGRYLLYTTLNQHHSGLSAIYALDVTTGQHYIVEENTVSKSHPQAGKTVHYMPPQWVDPCCRILVLHTNAAKSEFRLVVKNISGEIVEDRGEYDPGGPYFYAQNNTIISLDYNYVSQSPGVRYSIPRQDGAHSYHILQNVDVDQQARVLYVDREQYLQMLPLNQVDDRWVFTSDTLHPFVAEKILDDPVKLYNPLWMPSGNKLSLWAKTGMNRSLWIIDQSGGNFQKVLESHGFTYDTSWSADEQFVLWADESKHDFMRTIFITSLESQQTVRVTDQSYANSLWNPVDLRLFVTVEQINGQNVFVFYRLAL